MNASATDDSHRSATFSQHSMMPSQGVGMPGWLHVPVVLMATKNRSEAFVSHASRPDESAVASTLDWQARRRDSFFPSAFSFAARLQLSAYAGAPIARRITVAESTRLGRIDAMWPPVVGLLPTKIGRASCRERV